MICAPSRSSSSSARCSVLFVYVVVRDSQRLACLAVPAKRVHQRTHAAPADERHDDVDRVRRGHFGAKLVPNGWLARGVREDGRVEQRREGALDRLWSSVRKTSQQRDQYAPGVDRFVAAQVALPSVSAWRCRMSAAAMRIASSLRFPSGARSIALASMPARCRDMRSDASASRSSASSARSVPSGISVSSFSSLRVSSASWSPGFRESLVKPLESLSLLCSSPRSWRRADRAGSEIDGERPADAFGPLSGGLALLAGDAVPVAVKIPVPAHRPVVDQGAA